MNKEQGAPIAPFLTCGLTDSKAWILVIFSAIAELDQPNSATGGCDA